MDGDLLIMQGISKLYSGIHALDKVDFTMRKGEVHALIGENGAGKSTLMKILAGVEKKDGGKVFFHGKEYQAKGAKDALNNGIVFVHQELNMMEHLTVAQNIFIGREYTKHNNWVLDEKKQNEEASLLLEKMKIAIDPRTRLRDLTVGKQQMIEIAKAVSRMQSIIIFDEPSSSLTDNEIDELFFAIDHLKSKGVGIIYISHRLDEIIKLADRVTVLRDGKNVGQAEKNEFSKASLISMMVGRSLYAQPKTKSDVKPDSKIVLKVEGLNAGRMVQDVNFQLHQGEILGFSGLMGAGRTETALALFGMGKTSGTITINGKEVTIESPKDAIRNGLGYLSEDRKRYGLCVDLPVLANEMLPSYEQLSHRFFLDDKKFEEIADKFSHVLSIKAPSLTTKAKNLSGGNQQKVVIAKWLIKDCEILIFDEPTRGIDVGAKSEIYALMKELAKNGKSIIMISSEMEEILRMSDRIAVMCEGHITGILNIEDATQESIMHLAVLN